MPRNGVLIAAALAAAGTILGGCAYEPPMRDGQDPAAFRQAVEACQESGDKEARRRVMARFPLWLTYPISLPIEIRVQTKRCMEAKDL